MESKKLVIAMPEDNRGSVNIKNIPYLWRVKGSKELNIQEAIKGVCENNGLDIPKAYESHKVIAFNTWAFADVAFELSKTNTKPIT